MSSEVEDSKKVVRTNSYSMRLAAQSSAQAEPSTFRGLSSPSYLSTTSATSPLATNGRPPSSGSLASFAQTPCYSPMYPSYISSPTIKSMSKSQRTTSASLPTTFQWGSMALLENKFPVTHMSTNSPAVTPPAAIPVAPQQRPSARAGNGNMHPSDSPVPTMVPTNVVSPKRQRLANDTLGPLKSNTLFPRRSASNLDLLSAAALPGPDLKAKKERDEDSQSDAESDSGSDLSAYDTVGTGTTKPRFPHNEYAASDGDESDDTLLASQDRVVELERLRHVHQDVINKHAAIIVSGKVKTLMRNKNKRKLTAYCTLEEKNKKKRKNGQMMEDVTEGEEVEDEVEVERIQLKARNNSKTTATATATATAKNKKNKKAAAKQSEAGSGNSSKRKGNKGVTTERISLTDTGSDGSGVTKINADGSAGASRLVIKPVDMDLVHLRCPSADASPLPFSLFEAKTQFMRVIPHNLHTGEALQHLSATTHYYFRDNNNFDTTFRHTQEDSATVKFELSGGRRLFDSTTRSKLRWFEIEFRDPQGALVLKWALQQSERDSHYSAYSMAFDTKRRCVVILKRFSSANLKCKRSLDKQGNKAPAVPPHRTFRVSVAGLLGTWVRHVACKVDGAAETLPVFQNPTTTAPSEADYLARLVTRSAIIEPSSVKWSAEKTEEELAADRAVVEAASVMTSTFSVGE